MNNLIILAFYLDVRGYTPEAISELVRITDEELAKTFTAVPNHIIKHFIVPTDHNHIQCVYPLAVNSDELVKQQTEALTNLNELVLTMVQEYKSRLPEQELINKQPITLEQIKLSPSMEELIHGNNQLNNESNENKQVSMEPNDAEGTEAV